MKHDNMLAMILAGGRGTRLHDLTKKVAKPAVSYGGKYRIIDFPLSNCANSGIDVVGVLTQYESVLLNSYAAAGRRWGLDAKDSGVYVLPPREKADANLDVYRGTADAISQNIDFIDTYSPDYLLILSGDHIYKMNYDKMLEYHKAKNADATIAVLDVPKEEASRFGIMITDEDDNIIDFEEKPKNPRSTLASMGIYIFTWKKLKAYLIANENDKEASKDFGKNIIPDMREAGEKLVAYRFDGYWKDVGTIDSLWEANMDLINPNIPIDLYDTSWKIYSRNPVMPPQSIGKNAQVQNSMVTEGCVIDGSVEFSMISDGVTVEEGAEILDSILMPGAVVKKGAKVEYAIVGENTVIGENAQIGARPETIEDKDSWGVAVVGNNLTVSDGSVVAPKAIIYENI